MKKCGHGCSYWDTKGDSCNVNPKPVTERTAESVGCKSHDGPHAPLDGQMEFDTPIYLLELCRKCKGTPATFKCGFENVPDTETGEIVGLRCTGYSHVEEEATQGSLCSRCKLDPTNGADEPCGEEVDDIDGTCTRFLIAEGAWPCSECSRYDGEEVDPECDMQDDGLCESFNQIDKDVDPVTGEIINNRLCLGCADYQVTCDGKTDGAVECDDFKEPPTETEAEEQTPAEVEA